jgi:hypothetical protein
MKSDADRHYSEETLERYSMGSLPEALAVPVGDHLLVCTGCRRRLREIKSFVAATRKALKSTGDAPLNFRHYTSDGPIRVFVEPRQAAGWMACHEGEQLQGRWPCRTLRQANRLADELFRQMFPEHRCGPRCGPVLQAHRKESVSV